MYIFELIRFARVFSYVTDFNAHNKILTAKLLQRSTSYGVHISELIRFARMFTYVTDFNAHIK